MTHPSPEPSKVRKALRGAQFIGDEPDSRGIRIACAAQGVFVGKRLAGWSAGMPCPSSACDSRLSRIISHCRVPLRQCIHVINKYPPMALLLCNDIHAVVPMNQTIAQIGRRAAVLAQ
jgi:hypothetical protein